MALWLNEKNGPNAANMTPLLRKKNPVIFWERCEARWWRNGEDNPSILIRQICIWQPSVVRFQTMSNFLLLFNLAIRCFPKYSWKQKCLPIFRYTNYVISEFLPIILLAWKNCRKLAIRPLKSGAWKTILSLSWRWFCLPSVEGFVIMACQVCVPPRVQTVVIAREQNAIFKGNAQQKMVL